MGENYTQACFVLTLQNFERKEKNQKVVNKVYLIKRKSNFPVCLHAAVTSKFHSNRHIDMFNFIQVSGTNLEESRTKDEFGSFIFVCGLGFRTDQPSTDVE